MLREYGNAYYDVLCFTSVVSLHTCMQSKITCTYFLFLPMNNTLPSLLQVVQKEREEKLAEILKDRLNLYVQGNKDDFILHSEAEVSRLSNAGNIFFFPNFGAVAAQM